MKDAVPEASVPTSASLLDRAKARDPEAWARLTAVYGPLVYRWARLARLQGSDAADVTQEVFRSVAGSLANFHHDRAGDSFRGWLRTITDNKIRDHFRRLAAGPQAAGGSEAQERLQQVPACSASSVSSDPQEEAAQVRGRALALIRAEFDEKKWQAFWRTAVEGDRPADVAADLGMSLWQVYKIKARVLARLRVIFRDLLE